MEIKLRPYQEQAYKQWMEAWTKRAGRKLPQRIKRPIIHMATGGGKTVLFVEAMKRHINKHPDHRVVLIAHTRELIYQMYGAFFDVWPDMPHRTPLGRPFIGMEMAEKTANDAQIIVATRQSLISRLPDILRYGKVDVLIIDEAHHYSPDNSYQTIIDTLQDKNLELKVVGFTATPERGDGKALQEAFDEIVFRWTITDGISDGYLVAPYRIVYGVDLSLENVVISGDDYNMADLVRTLNSADWVEHAAKAYFEMIHKKRNKCLAFMPSVEMGKRLHKILVDGGVLAHYIDAQTDKEDRARYLREFADGPYECIVNVMVLTEGVNIPVVDAILNGRPTQNMSLYTQIVGRALRTAPNKKDALIVDLSTKGDIELFGDLLGKVRNCHECKAIYSFGKKTCPNCGVAVVFKRDNVEGGEEEEETAGKPPPRKFETIVGKREKKLIKKSANAWYVDPNGWMSVGAGKDDMFMIIIPTQQDVTKHFEYLLHYSGEPNAEFRLRDLLMKIALKYTLVHYNNNSHITRVVAHHEDIEELFVLADKEANAFGGALSKKRADWRRGVITSGQKWRLQQYPIALKKTKIPLDSILPTLTKGEASAIIGHLIIMDGFIAYHEKLQAEVKKERERK